MGSLASPRRFKVFPGDAWGRKAKWFDTKTRDVLSSREARSLFDRGIVIGYVSGGFVYSVIKEDPDGREPTL